MEKARDHSLSKNQPKRAQNSLNRFITNPSRNNNNATALRSSSITNKLKQSTLQSTNILPTVAMSTSNGKIDYFNTVTKNTYTYFVGGGNNDGLIRRIMKHRSYWVETKQNSSMFVNFKWQQSQRGYKYERLLENGSYKEVVNHFQNHSCLTNKESLFRNLEAYCNKHKLNILDYIPPTFVLNANDDFSSQALNNFLDFYFQYWPESAKKGEEQLKKIIADSRRKLRYFFNSTNQKKIFPKFTMDDIFLSTQNNTYLWILKPTFLNRGRGIQVFSDLNVLYKIISENVDGYIQKSLQPNKQEVLRSQKKTTTTKLSLPQINEKQKQKKRNNKTIILQKIQPPKIDPNSYMRMASNLPCIIKTDAFIIQKYLQRPLLINQRKFDMRVWVLVTHQLNCYFFKQGYIRLSSQAYKTDSSNITNQFIHLTNNAVQKYSTNYNSFCQGNQLSFQWLYKYLVQKGQDKSCMQKIIKGIKQYITVSLKAVTKKIDPFHRKFCFEIFGYDFILDETLKPWLIQVNNNPCIEESSPLLAMLLPRMLDDAFKMTLDYLFPPIYTKPENSNSKIIDENQELGPLRSKPSLFKVTGYKDTESMWDFLIKLNNQEKKSKKY